MWTGFSPPATAAIAGNCVVAISVQVFSSAGVFLQDITDGMTTGEVVEDETAAVRRTLSLTLNDPALIPNQPSDLLHPLTGNEIYAYRGVQVDGADGPELAPLGIFRMSMPAITDDGTTLADTITGNDRSAEISRRSWTGPYTAAAGQTVPVAIKAIITSRWVGPALTFNLFPSPVVVPVGTVLGIQYTSSGPQSESGSTSGNNDPWADCVLLAKSAGCELLFDRVGVVVMRPVPQPGQSPIVADFSEGPGCTVTSGSRTLDETTFHNAVIVVGTGTTVTNSDGSVSPGAPVVASSLSTDPNFGVAAYGEIPDIITDETVSTVPQAQAVADAQLALIMSELETTGFSAVDNPALDAGDSIFLERSRMFLGSWYIMQSVTHPLDATTTMTVANRSYTVTA